MSVGTNELFFSVDIESDGPIPGRNSMLSFGCAAFTDRGKLLDTYSANLDVLPEATPDPDTMKWWEGQKEAWEACRKDTRPAEVVMPEFVAWVKKVAGRDSPVFVGYPAGFDFEFIHWYLVRFTGSSVFGFSCIDMKTFAMALLGTDFKGTTKRSMPKRWFKNLPKHTHVALDDAIEQGCLFINMLKEAPNRK